MKPNYFLFLFIIPSLLLGQQHQDVDWTNDDQMIVFNANRDSTNNIFRINVDGTGLLNLTQSSVPVYNAQLTNDDQWIIYYSYLSGKHQIYRISLDGNSKENLTNSNSEELFPVVSPDGDKIVFMSTQSDYGRLCIVDINGENRNCITDPESAATYPIWGRNSEEIIYTELNVFASPEDRVVQKWGNTKTGDFKRIFNNPKAQTIFLTWLNDEEYLYHEKFPNYEGKSFSVIYKFNTIDESKVKIIKKVNEVKSVIVNPVDSDILLINTGMLLIPTGQLMPSNAVYVFKIGNKKPVKIGKFNYGMWSNNGKYIAVNNGKQLAICDANGDNLKFILE